MEGRIVFLKTVEKEKRKMRGRIGGGNMKRALLVIALVLSQLAAFSQEAKFREKPEWGKYFSDEGVEGTMVVVDERNGTRQVYNIARAGARFIPASTFKIPHALFALNIDMPKGGKDAPKRESIARAVLASIGALPGK
jgi:beta-lactamase class D